MAGYTRRQAKTGGGKKTATERQSVALIMHDLECAQSDAGGGRG
eukprot:CAMPEP_0113682054 /NCGR_PEP_ID=MMETSP0038_2-20120614/12397_1 /TAXON_ID=2898 /ORGANISM="Cryptomonas paramecium" /LENGTH=43 /DNA_ID=CAMNT_0000600975 /DNA_START=38 /DNA_END=165 /DNA_ORIENTATION=- /assembly_acc=CAM_ASM_000170